MLALALALVVSSATAPARPFSAPDDDLSGARLSGLDLSRRDFTHAVLDGAELRGTLLRRALLRGASLRQARAEGADFFRAELRGADLRGAALAGDRLDGADVREADLRGADLSSATVSGALLSGALYDETTRLPFSRPEAFRRGLVFLGRRLAPVDESASDPSFRLFMIGFSSAVAARDAGVVSARLSRGLRRQCYKDRVFTCWPELDAAVTGGGLFTDAADSGFWAPYDAALWPSGGRPDLAAGTTSVALLAGDVPARAAPEEAAPAVATLSDALVTVAGRREDWLLVRWPGGSGWVPTGRARFPAGERRVWFEREGDEWMVVEIAPVPQ